MGSYRMPRSTRKTKGKSRKTRRVRTVRYQKGGLVEDYLGLFDSAFGDQWILTGSEAVRLLAEHFRISHTLRPSDLDVVVVSPDLFYGRFIGPFQRVQTTPERSMTFKSEAGHSFDILTTQKERYVEVPFSGRVVRVMDPASLSREYKSELSMRGNKQNADWQKIFVLEQVLMHPPLPAGEIDTRRRRATNTNRYVGNPVRSMSLFDNTGTPPRTPQRGGFIPDIATVVISQDPDDYSVPVMVSAEEAKNIFAAHE
jgi:hypothetical protein